MKTKKTKQQLLLESISKLQTELEESKNNFDLEIRKRMRLQSDIKDISDMAKAMENAHLMVSNSSQQGSVDEAVLRETSTAWMRIRLAIDQMIEKNCDKNTY